MASNEDHVSSAALGQGVGYGIVLGLGGAFALGMFMMPRPGPVNGSRKLTVTQA